MTPNRIFWGVMGLIGAIAASVLLADAIGKSTDSVLLVTLFGALIAGFARIVLRPYWDRIMAEGFLGAFDVADADDVDIKSPFGFPDIDATCTIYGLESLAMRRGLTHGPIAWVLLPLALAMLLWAWDRWQAKRGKRPAARAPVHFWWLYGLALIGCLTHPALDWMNNYGVRLLEPFSQQWFYGDTLFIIDLWMWIGLGLATWFSLRREKRGGEWRLPARAALAGLLVYIGANMLITYRTELSGQGVEPYPNQVIASPPPVAFWRRDVITSTGPGLWQVNGEDVGNIPLSRCDLDAAGQTDPRVAAFLFWSRAPFLHRKADGQWVLADARYVRAPTGGDRFSVILPHGLCREESQKEAG